MNELERMLLDTDISGTVFSDGFYVTREEFAREAGKVFTVGTFEDNPEGCTKLVVERIKRRGGGKFMDNWTEGYTPCVSMGEDGLSEARSGLSLNGQDPRDTLFCAAQLYEVAASECRDRAKKIPKQPRTFEYECMKCGKMSHTRICSSECGKSLYSIQMRTIVINRAYAISTRIGWGIANGKIDMPDSLRENTMKDLEAIIEAAVFR